jgi:hypothetical protein
MALPEAGWLEPSQMSPEQAEQCRLLNLNVVGRPPDPLLSIRHVERLPLGTKYPKVVEHLKNLVSREPVRGKAIALLVDYTGVGRGVVDAMTQERLAPIGITLHGGSTVSKDPGGWYYRVPVRELVGTTRMLLEDQKLKIASGMPHWEILIHELTNFQRKINPETAHDSYAAGRESEHDDLVFAVSMAVWFRQYYNQHIDEAAAGLVIM